MSDESLPKSIVGSIAVGNTSVAQQPAILANVAMGNLVQNVNMAQQNAVSAQQSMNQLQMATLGKAVNVLTSQGPAQAAAARVNQNEQALYRLLLKLLTSKTQ
jgi:hypothetical protein